MRVNTSAEWCLRNSAVVSNPKLCAAAVAISAASGSGKLIGSAWRIWCGGSHYPQARFGELAGAVRVGALGGGEIRQSVSD
jgi:hypothetical protein